jgi:phage terminase large subunit-like protein
LGEPRIVYVSPTDIAGMTWLEIARAAALAGVKRGDWTAAIHATADVNAEPAEALRGTLLAYAWAYVLVRRDEPAVTFDEAQTWDVRVTNEPIDPALDDEARASVEAAILSGLPPHEAGKLTTSELAAYAELAERAGR